MCGLLHTAVDEGGVGEGSRGSHQRTRRAVGDDPTPRTTSGVTGKDARPRHVAVARRTTFFLTLLLAFLPITLIREVIGCRSLLSRPKIEWRKKRKKVVPFRSCFWSVQTYTKIIANAKDSKRSKVRACSFWSWLTIFRASFSIRCWNVSSKIE